MNTDNTTKAHANANAYLQLATLQTKLDEDDYIISMLQLDCDDSHTAINLIAARRKSLSRELRKVKKQIGEIEEKWGKR